MSKKSAAANTATNTVEFNVGSTNTEEEVSTGETTNTGDATTVSVSYTHLTLPTTPYV